MASRKKRGYSDLDLHPPPRGPKRSKNDNRTSLQALTLHQNNDAETLAGTIPSSSPTLIASSSSSASSQTSADSGSVEPIPSLLESSDDSPSESDDISSSDSSDPSSSSLELNRPAMPLQNHPNYANRDTDSSSSSSSDLSSSSSDSADSDPSSSESGSHSGSNDPRSSPSSDSPSSSSSLSRSPIPLTSQNLSTLQSRVTSFLPTMHAANQRLEVERAEGKLADRDIENVREDEGGYIEMDLGLGVLEEKGKEILAIEAKAEGGDEESSQGEERDVLGRLMGRRREKPAIQIV